MSVRNKSQAGATVSHLPKAWFAYGVPRPVANKTQRGDFVNVVVNGQKPSTPSNAAKCLRHASLCVLSHPVQYILCQWFARRLVKEVAYSGHIFARMFITALYSAHIFTCRLAKATLYYAYIYLQVNV